MSGPADGWPTIRRLVPFTGGSTTSSVVETPLNGWDSGEEAHPGAKVAELTRILDEGGDLASWEKVSPGVFRIVEHNCAIWAVAERYGQACASEFEFIRIELDGVDGERVQHMIAGARRCAYEVRDTVRASGDFER